jgi:hypothetical protein
LWRVLRVSVLDVLVRRSGHARSSLTDSHCRTQEWLKFNNAQRGHQNLVESSACAFATLFGAGVFYPLTAARLGAVYSVGRLLYGYGYVHGGANGRIAGIALAHVGDFGLLFTMINGGVWPCLQRRPRSV